MNGAEWPLVILTTIVIVGTIIHVFLSVAKDIDLKNW